MLISSHTHTEAIKTQIFQSDTPNQTYNFSRTRKEIKSAKLKLKWRWNALSGYVREPSGALTLTLLSCSHHTVSYTALHTDLNPMNSAIRLTPNYMTSRSTAITQGSLEFIHYRQYFQKLSTPECYILEKKKEKESLVQVCAISFIIKIRWSR